MTTQFRTDTINGLRIESSFTQGNGGWQSPHKFTALADRALTSDEVDELQSNWGYIVQGYGRHEARVSPLPEGHTGVFTRWTCSTSCD